MNKQEAIETIEQYKIQLGRVVEINREVNAIQRKIEMVDYVPLETVVSMIDKINEPQKPVVPKFVAEWIEKYKNKKKKYRLAHALGHVFNDAEVSFYIKQQEGDYTETIAEAWLYGYTVEQEKLYTVEIPNPHSYIDNHSRLAKNYKGKVVLEVQDWLNIEESYKLTESEIKEDFEWAFQFAKPVEE